MPRNAPPAGNDPASEPPPRAESKEEFAGRLRELRAHAGSPSLRELAKITNYSSSTLGDATSGKRLPTEPVLKALVAACGANPAPWVDELRRLTALERSADWTDDHAAGAPRAGREGRSGRLRVAGLAVLALAIFGAGALTGRLLAPQAAGQLPGVPAYSGTPSPAPTARIADGTDPHVGHCEGDAHLIDRVAVIRDGVQIGSLDLMYSGSCGAGWARIYLYPGEPTMMGEVSVRSGDGRFNTFTDPLVKQVDDYTDVVVPGPGGCIGAGGAIYQRGKPVVTAVIPCQVPAAG